MTHFLIQTIKGQVVHDFAFHLIKAIEYHNWFRNEVVYSYALSEAPKATSKGVPIGSLEYVFSYIEQEGEVSKSHIRPINIPSSLMPEQFTGRTVFLANRVNIPSPENWFVKSNTQYKTVAEEIYDTEGLPEDEYLVSSLIDIDSEWRAFIQQGELVGLQHYVGDFLCFPDVLQLKEMINAYQDAPASYTLDVGVMTGTTVVIEVHPFVSCGLYGFSNYQRLPSMMIQGYYAMKIMAVQHKLFCKREQ